MSRTLRARFVLQDNYTRTVERMIRTTDQYTRAGGAASRQADNLNNSIRRTGTTASSVTTGITKMIQAFMGLRIVQTLINGIVKGMQTMDTYSNTLARLKLINDDKQTPTELNDKIFAAANRSRGSYGTMSESVARIGMLAGKSFSSNDELIGFTELVQKSFKLGGADTMEQQSAMLQLSQAMASGRLQGDEYRSIIENAPLIADAIAKYTGVGREGLKQLSSDGAITADIIKNSMFSMADEINEQFKTIPKTWSDYMTLVQNESLRAFSGVFDAISVLINTEGFQQFVQFIINSIYVIAAVATWLVESIAADWDFISAILYAGLIVGVAMLAAYLWNVVPPALASAAAFVVMHAPLFIAIGLIALIIYAMNKLGITVIDVVGGITGAVTIMLAQIANKFILLYNVGADVGNFFANVFKDPVASIKILFFDLASTVIGYILKMASAVENLVNSIPGVEINITGKIEGIKNSIEQASKLAKDQMGWEEVWKKKEYIDLTEAGTKGYNAGKSFVDGIGNKLKNAFNGLSYNPQSAIDLSSIVGKNVPKSPKIQKVEGKGKNGAVKVEMSDEDIKYLRDSAERDFVAKIQHKTLAPNINVKFTGPISKEADTDKMYKRITKILKEEIAMAGEV
uniref:Tail tape measure n=1 Tax=Siphoviridae sp. ctdd214 TaxID=2825581 RepID=A0A8S5V614_9CAUD|nr:MAG TPA: Tail tape measure [Siphoviridae sp. ctdd214]